MKTWIVELYNDDFGIVCADSEEEAEREAYKDYGIATFYKFKCLFLYIYTNFRVCRNLFAKGIDFVAIL